MKPTRLKPGMQVLNMDTFGAPQLMTFIRRDKACCGQSASNLFQCPDFVGLDGPDDKGLTRMGDGRVARYIFPAVGGAS